ncbi:uncharacterized protein LOC128992991 [Macrosteles quadrilineatus]|uniref:uncharacterized protein LOC128992991 n=1 Tax=Macrosteles quadrilineatus TaxID=74068 RepID=UPI0023E0AC1E|nr:uncharacterized protein LOC128992991 [Macrosteles quadrilineatus]
MCRRFTCCLVHKELRLGEPRYLSGMLIYKGEICLLGTRSDRRPHFTKDELERRHEQYQGSLIYTLYYDDDDFVRVGKDGKFLEQPLSRFMRDQYLDISQMYAKMVLLKVRTSSVLKGDTEIFQKICKAKGEPKHYPVVYFESYKRLNGILYLSTPAGKWEHVWNKCPIQEERNESLQKPLD